MQSTESDAQRMAAPRAAAIGDDAGRRDDEFASAAADIEKVLAGTDL
jgi:hypothetical protein